jgi:ankyrin repeat protein
MALRGKALLVARRGACNAADIAALLDAGGSVLCFLACDAGDAVLARLLLRHSALVAAEHDNASTLAAAGGAGVLGRERADTYGAPLLLANARLWEASYDGNDASVRALLATGADADAADEAGQTPLLLASSRGHVRVVQTLLARGANVFAQDRHGTTALQAAKERGHAAVVVALEAAIAAWWSVEDDSSEGGSDGDGDGDDTLDRG